MIHSKILLIQLLAFEANFIKRETLGESMSLVAGNNSIPTAVETTTEIPCDWSWARRHALALTGFIIGFIGFPMCLCCTGFRPGGVAGGSCAAGVQR